MIFYSLFFDSKWLTHSLSDSLIHYVAHWLTDWLTDWPTLTRLPNHQGKVCTLVPSLSGCPSCCPVSRAAVKTRWGDLYSVRSQWQVNSLIKSISRFGTSEVKISLHELWYGSAEPHLKQVNSLGIYCKLYICRTKCLLSKCKTMTVYSPGSKIQQTLTLWSRCICGLWNTVLSLLWDSTALSHSLPTAHRPVSFMLEATCVTAC